MEKRKELQFPKEFPDRESGSRLLERILSHNRVKTSFLMLGVSRGSLMDEVASRKALSKASISTLVRPTHVHLVTFGCCPVIRPSGDFFLPHPTSVPQDSWP